jgi:hypothetical protein
LTSVLISEIGFEGKDAAKSKMTVKANLETSGKLNCEERDVAGEFGWD